MPRFPIPAVCGRTSWTTQGAALGGPLGPLVSADEWTDAASVGDLVESSGWEAAWIDLGGEG